MNDSLRKRLLRLAERHETPFFALDEKVLKQNLAEFEKTAKAFFPRLEACYSVKTNSLPEVLKALNCGFEVSSLKELQLVKKRKSFKVFNSPCKKAEEIQEALRQKAVIVADSFSDLEKIAGITGKKDLEIGLRLNYNSRKFGFSIQQLSTALKKCKERGLKAVMLHCHAGTMQSLQDYELFLKHFSKAAGLHDWKFLNFGGGFPSFSSLEGKALKLEGFFEKIKAILEGKFEGKTIVFEPGRILVEDSMFLVSKVCAVKELNNQKIAVLDAGINLLQKIALSDFKFSPLGKADAGKTLLAGPLLFNSDFFEEIPFELNEGDFIAVENVGAYCLMIAWQAFEKPKVIKI